MKSILILCLCVTTAIAQNLTPQQQPQSTQKKELLHQIFSQQNTATFKTSLANARKAGIPEQTLLEARFLHSIDQNDTSSLALIAPDLLAYRKRFNLDISEVFATQEDWLSVIEYTQAITALTKSDHDAFKAHIKEAFWLNPRHAEIYAPHIERLRLKQAMEKTTISKELQLHLQQGGAPISFSSLTEGKKAVILHFWSPTSQEVITNMPDFALTTAECQTHGITTASILIDKSPELLKEAEAIQQKNQDDAKCLWLIDTSKPSLTQTLKVTNIPTVVIVSIEGKILFNGHPSEPEFWDTLEKITPNFSRPKAPQH